MDGEAANGGLGGGGAASWKRRAKDWAQIDGRVKGGKESPWGGCHVMLIYLSIYIYISRSIHDRALISHGTKLTIICRMGGSSSGARMVTSHRVPT